MSTRQDHAAGRPRPRLCLALWRVQSPINLGMILRVAETYEVDVAVCGASDITAHPDRLQTVRDFACGALERRGLAEHATFEALVASAGTRRIFATTIDPNATALFDHRFQPDDIVLLGNEYDGLPPEIVRAAAGLLHIPMADVRVPKPRSSRPIDASRTEPVLHDGMANLNVAIAAGIICYDWFRRGHAG